MIRPIITSILTCAVLISTNTADAANVAFDTAADPVYNDGWQSGDNGGYGFGPWALLKLGSSSGHFMAGSTGNGDGADDGNINGAANDLDIDTAGRAWGMYASIDSQGDGAGAVRPLTGGALGIGQSISLDMDNGYISNVGFNYVGVTFVASNDSVLFRFEGGDSNYEVYSNNLATLSPSTLPFADEGLSLSLTRTGFNTVSLTATLRNGATQTLPLTLNGPNGADIQTVLMTNDSAGQGPAHDAFFNSMTVTPEPASAALLGIAGAFAFNRRIRS